MSTEVQIDEAGAPGFWEDATKYARFVDEDRPFVEEIAYMMVTLHKNGA